MNATVGEGWIWEIILLQKILAKLRSSVKLRGLHSLPFFKRVEMWNIVFRVFAGEHNRRSIFYIKPTRGQFRRQVCCANTAVTEVRRCSRIVKINDLLFLERVAVCGDNSQFALRQVEVGIFSLERWQGDERASFPIQAVPSTPNDVAF